MKIYFKKIFKIISSYLFLFTVGASQTVDSVPVPKHIVCQECKYPYRNATKTHCCTFTYCNECIRQAILQDDEFLCPVCRKRCPPELLKPNKVMQKLADAFTRDHPETKHPSLRPVPEIPPLEPEKPEPVESSEVKESEKKSESVKSKSRSPARTKESVKNSPLPPQLNGNGVLPQVMPMMLPQQAILQPQQQFPIALNQLLPRLPAQLPPAGGLRRNFSHPARRVDHRGYRYRDSVYCITLCLLDDGEFRYINIGFNTIDHSVACVACFILLSR